MSKNWCSYEQQLQLLKNRGLLVEDDAFAIHCIGHYNYYRLSVYWRVFTLPEDHDHFREGTTFQPFLSSLFPLWAFLSTGKIDLFGRKSWTLNFRMASLHVEDLLHWIR